MEKYREKDGFINLSNITSVNPDYYLFNFMYDNKKYWFKAFGDEDLVYNELIAEELAKDFGILCAHYDIAKYKGNIGVVSEDIFENKYEELFISDILEECYNTKSTSSKNNLEDIWNAFEYRYNDKKIVNMLMNNLVNVFMFDILIGNMDRHTSNYAIIEEDGIPKIKIFDNELMLSEVCIMLGGYSIGIDDSDNFFLSSEYNPSEENYLHKFLRVSDSPYKEMLNEKLWIISDENLDNVLLRIENRTNKKIDIELKKEIKNKFNENRKMIIKQLEEHKNKRKLG